MRRTSAVIVAATLVASHAAYAQRRALPAPATAFDVTPYAGYLLSGSFISGPLGTGVGPAPAPMVGAQLGMHVAPNLSVIANIATASSDVRAGIPILGGISVAQSRAVLYDAGLQLDLPLAAGGGASLAPFVQAGVGGLRYDLSQSFGSSTSHTLAGNVGIGADVAVGSGVGVRLMAKDYVSQYDFQGLTSLVVRPGTTQSYAFSAGVRFSF